MCKFLVQATPASQKASELLGEKIQKVHVLEEENKALEAQITGRKTAGPSVKSSKLEDLLNKLKKLDDIALHLEEKNRNSEIVIKKQTRMIVHLKEKCDKANKEASELKAENERMAEKIKEMEKLLEVKNSENLRNSVKNAKIEEGDTEESEVNQSMTSEIELRKSLVIERKNRANTMTTYCTPLDLPFERTVLRKMQSEILPVSGEQISDFGSFLNSERKISLQNDESFVKQLEEAKSNAKVFRRPFIYYHQIQLISLSQKLGLGKFF